MLLDKRKSIVNFSLLVIMTLLVTSFFNASTVDAKLQENNHGNSFNSDFYAWVWSPAEVVSTESTLESAEPLMAVDKIGNIHVVWQDFTNYSDSGDDQDIFYKQWEYGSKSWKTTEVVSTESTGVSRYAAIAVDDAGNAYVAWEDQTNYDGAGADKDIFYKRRDAISGTWGITEVVSTESTGLSTDSTIAVDKNRNVHLAWTDTTNYNGSGTDSDIFYKRWNATTMSWTVTEVVTTAIMGASGLSSITVDNVGNAHLVWADGSEYGGSGSDADIYYNKWDASSQSWSSPQVVSTESDDFSSYPSVVVDSTGLIHVAWLDMSNYTYPDEFQDVFYKRWEDTTSWTTTELITSETGGSVFRCSLAVDSKRNVHITWGEGSSYGNSGSDQDIFYRRWEDSSKSWTTTEVVSTESSVAFSLYSSVGVDIKGNVHIVWEDGVNYNNSGSDRDILYKRLFGPPETPELAFIFPNPTESSTILLDWNDIFGATEYYVFRSDSYIWLVEGLTAIETTTISSYSDSLPDEGQYYYVILATNGMLNSTISNCQFVNYEIPHLSEFVLTISILFPSAAIIAVIVLEIRKYKQKT